MRYAAAKARENERADAYRIYISETLYFMSRGESPTMRVQEFLNPKPEPEDTRTAEEIISSMKDRLERLVEQ